MTSRSLQPFGDDARFSISSRREPAYALYLAQIGEKYARAKRLKALGPGVLEVVSDHRGDTFRGATPQSDIDLIRQRLKRATELHDEREK